MKIYFHSYTGSKWIPKLYTPYHVIHTHLRNTLKNNVTLLKSNCTLNSKLQISKTLTLCTLDLVQLLNFKLNVHFLTFQKGSMIFKRASY